MIPKAERLVGIFKIKTMKKDIIILSVIAVGEIIMVGLITMYLLKDQL